MDKIGGNDMRPVHATRRHLVFITLSAKGSDGLKVCFAKQVRPLSSEEADSWPPKHPIGPIHFYGQTRLMLRSVVVTTCLLH